MSDAVYKYEVAFSFLSEDEPLAAELNDLLQDQFATFLYSKKQETVAATDGEQTFSTVFAKDSRIVVVLFRAKWGTTPWTRIEETAIRNRAYEDGYDFTVFVPLEKGASLPPWIPKTRLFVGLERWGVAGAAGVIETRVREAGGETRTESPVDRASRLKRSMDFEETRRTFLKSQEGVNAAHAAVARLIDALATSAAEIGEKSQLHIKVARNQRWIDLCAGQGCLGLTWNGRYSNVLDESYLHVGFWEGTPPRSGRHYFRGDEPRKLHDERFDLDMGPGGAIGWRTSKEQFLPETEMADHLLKLLLDLTRKRQMAERR